jgi:hypothetical protein
MNGAGRHPYQYGRGLLFDIQTRNEGYYQHCSEKHLHRYLAEFDFRYSNRVALGIDDTARSSKAISGIVGKRLLPTAVMSGGASAECSGVVAFKSTSEATYYA